jgi:hypothetical protein
MPEFFDPNVPHLFVDKSCITLIVDGNEFSFSSAIWDAMVRYVNKCRAGEAEEWVEITDLPFELKWDGTLPSA